MKRLLVLLTVLLCNQVFADGTIPKLQHELSPRGQQAAICIAFFRATMKVALEKHPDISKRKEVGEGMPLSHQYYFSAENRGLHLSKMFDKNTRSAAVKIIKEKEDSFLAELKKGYPKLTKKSASNWDTCVELNNWWRKFVRIEGFF